LFSWKILREEDEVKKILIVLLFLSVSLLPLKAEESYKADFESDFQNATKLAPDGSEAARGTDLMIRDTTSVLHREHMAILDELAKLHKEIADMKKNVKYIKGQVE